MGREEGSHMGQIFSALASTNCQTVCVCVSAQIVSCSPDPTPSYLVFWSLEKKYLYFMFRRQEIEVVSTLNLFIKHSTVFIFPKYNF